jgi:hypothetical protein
MVLTTEHMKAARALLRWDQLRLSEASKVSIATIKRIEAQPGEVQANPVTIQAIERAFKDHGVEITNGGQPGVHMRPWSKGEKATLRSGSEGHATTFGVAKGEVLTVENWALHPGQGPGGHLDLRNVSGKLLRGLPAAHFERSA